MFNVILSLIQGIGEFLPISSSSNLIAASRWLAIPDMSLTTKITLHIGSLVALLCYYRRSLWQVLRALFTDRVKLKNTVFWTMVVGTIPLIMAGFCAYDFIKEFDSIKFIGINLIIFGVLLWLADSKCAARPTAKGYTRYIKDFVIGCFQCLAILPGVSRLGMCLTGCRMLGMKRDEAIKTSMLLAIPSIMGSVILEFTKLHDVSLLTGDIGKSILYTTMISLIAIYPCSKFMSKYGFFAIMVYRVLLGLLLIFG